MAEFNFSITDGSPDELAKLNKTLNWLMANLDHDNITRIYTEYCDIQSENGETVIDGPLVKMTAGTTTLRLKMGKEGSNFTFALYNNSGTQTVGIDSLGNGTFTGAITASAISGSTITGGTIQTSTAGARIVTNSSSLAFYDSTGVLRTSFSLINFLGVDYYDLRFNSQLGNFIASISAYDNQLSISAGMTSDILYLQGNAIQLVSNGVAITGPLSVTGTITGSLNGSVTGSAASLSGSGVINIGQTGCKLDVTGGDLRLKNANGAYLLISDATLIYYTSTGGAHIIV